MVKIFNKFFLALVFSAILLKADFVNSEVNFKIGNDQAKITIKVFSSLTCPHCKFS